MTGWGTVWFPKMLAYFSGSNYTDYPTFSPTTLYPTSKPTPAPSLPPSIFPQVPYFATSNPKSCGSQVIPRYRVTCYYCVSNVTNFLSITNPISLLFSYNNLILYVQSQNSIKSILVQTKSIITLLNCKLRLSRFISN